jgi:hypothetical protein
LVGNYAEQSKKERIAARIAEAPFALFPVARNIAPALVSAAMGQRQETYHLSPMESSVENMLHVIGHGVNLAGQGAGVTEGKGIEQKFTEDAAQAAAVVIGAPQQLNTWTFNYIDWLNDEGEPNWRDLVTRRKKQ